MADPHTPKLTARPARSELPGDHPDEGGYWWVHRDAPAARAVEDPWTRTGILDLRGRPIFKRDLRPGFTASHKAEYGTRDDGDA